jgi:hypothetical protein
MLCAADAAGAAREHKQRGPEMHVINHASPHGVEAVGAGSVGLTATAMTYELLRQVLAGSGIIEEREAQKMDRTIQRLLDR